MIKMLGVTFDTAGPQRKQKVATKLRLVRACTTLCAQRRLNSAVIAASVSSLTRASYTAPFTPWAAQDLTDLTNSQVICEFSLLTCSISPLVWAAWAPAAIHLC